jgi:hypothetical protein
MATRIRTTSRSVEDSGRVDVNGELAHIHDLVVLRSILADHGATQAELRSYDAEIETHRRELAIVWGQQPPLELSAA